MTKRNFVERTLIVFKPDVVRRRIVGEIMTHFEKAQLKIIGLKMVMATRELLESHLPINDFNWLNAIGVKNIAYCKSIGANPKEIFGVYDSVQIGKKIAEWTIEYYLEGPVIVMVLKGDGVIAYVRKKIGGTSPAEASPGTIREVFFHSNVYHDNFLGVSCMNGIHASGSEEEADREISVWFREDELVSY